ncbi:MAG: hypothetical protein M0Z87_01155 [Actinomycetota bacterium]|nr:hypothetical protein [Actinomycetota bacterium]
MLSDAQAMDVAARAVDAVSDALGKLDDWGPSGLRDGQYRCDLAADTAAIEVLRGAGIAVLSEESGRHGGSSQLTAVVDPVDGSTNAASGIPYYACSVAVVDREGPWVAVVANLATGARYRAVRGKGATLDGSALSPSRTGSVESALIGFNGWPSRHMGWRQYRVLGAAALELCAVAQGALDGYVDVTSDGLAPWDYMGALLICQEAGALVVEAEGRELWNVPADERRSVVAAGTPQLLEDLLAKRRAAARTVRVGGEGA